MSKIFVVTEGCYSDYRILAVCSTTEKAAEYIRLNQDPEQDPEVDKMNIEEYELDPVTKQKVWRDVWSVQMNMTTGAVLYGYPFEHRQELREGTRESEVYIVPPHTRNPFPYDGSISVTSAVSAEHALKLAAEARQNWLRENSQVGSTPVS